MSSALTFPNTLVVDMQHSCGKTFHTEMVHCGAHN